MIGSLHTDIWKRRIQTQGIEKKNQFSKKPGDVGLAGARGGDWVSYATAAAEFL